LSSEVAVRNIPDEKLASERVIINAPMSFAGAAQRAMRLREKAPAGPARWLMLAAIVLVVIPVWWTLVVGWYLIFGLWLVPYRLLRRGARKRKAEALRHRELLSTIEKSK
jgi:fatty acid desaturase